MSKKPLKIAGAAIRRPPQVREALAAGEAAEPMQLAVAVENPGDKPLHVWASRRHYDYDPASRVLTVYLTEHTPSPPPGIKIISDHPRTPAQVMVDAKGRATLDVIVPATIRRAVPGTGLGLKFVEEPIGPVDRVDLHIQSATEPIEPKSGESPEQHRNRLRQHGEVARANITPTERKE